MAQGVQFPANGGDAKVVLGFFGSGGRMCVGSNFAIQGMHRSFLGVCDITRPQGRRDETCNDSDIQQL